MILIFLFIHSQRARRKNLKNCSANLNERKEQIFFLVRNLVKPLLQPLLQKKDLIVHKTLEKQKHNQLI